MATLDRGDTEIYYEERGSGPAVLLSHGFSATSKMWAAQAEEFSKDFHVISWDMRGHGQSGYPEDPAAYSEEATVGDMAAILDACGVDTAVIGGLSLGGYMSLAFHLVHPERVRALMLFDTGPGYKNAEARAKWNESAEKTAARFDSEGLAAFAHMGSDEMKADAHRSADGLAGAARGMLSQRDDRVILSLPGIQVPTLALVGANDTPFLGATDYMAAKIPNAEKVVIPDAGHSSNLHQPEAFNAAMASFLAGLPEE